MKMTVFPFLTLCVSFLTFNAAVSDEDLPGISKTPSDAQLNITVLETWQNAEKFMKNMAHAAVKSILPSLMESSRTLNISSECTKQVLQVLAGLRNIKPWAMRFIDASGKMVDGLMYGSVSSFGAYDECIETEVKSTKFKEKGKLLFRGQYCTIDMKPPVPPKTHYNKLNEVLDVFKNFSQRDTVLADLSKFAHFFTLISLRLGICVPSGCSLDDIDQIVKNLAKTLYVDAEAKRCEVKEDAKFSPLIYSIITSFSFFAFMMLIGTLIDLYVFYKKVEYKSNALYILLCFSLFTNFRRFVNTDSSSETLSCLNGIRFLSMSWIILGHTYAAVNFQMILGLMKVQVFAKDFAFQVVLNAFSAVETFFFIGGLVVCYVTIKLVREQKHTFNVPIYVIHRLWRILPAYVHVIMFMFLLDLIGSGPIWYETTHPAIQSCYDNWWKNLLFINNFYEAEPMCIRISWYIAADFQLYIGAILILIPLIRWPKIGISLSIIAIIASIIYSGLATYVNNYTPGILLSVPDKDHWMDYWGNFYFRPFVHVGPYCIGILSGYLLATKPKFKIHPFVQVLGWTIAFICNFSAVYGITEWNRGTETSFLSTVLYASFHRTAWILGTAWMVIACATGHGGIVNYILSWKAFIPLGRLTYIAYLVHYIVQTVAVGNIRTQVQPDHFLAVWVYFGHLFVTYAIAFAGSMLIEAPFMSLEKIFMPRAGKKEEHSARRKNIRNGALQTRKNGNIAAIVVKENEELTGIENEAAVCRL